eukprot:6403188-Prymnesium_polylepis.1
MYSDTPTNKGPNPPGIVPSEKSGSMCKGSSTYCKWPFSATSSIGSSNGQRTTDAIIFEEVWVREAGEFAGTAEFGAVKLKRANAVRNRPSDRFSVKTTAKVHEVDGVVVRSGVCENSRKQGAEKVSYLSVSPDT